MTTRHQEPSSDGVSTTRPLQLLLLGPPAAGKGTQAALIAQRYGVVPVSTGDLMRELDVNSPHMPEIQKCIGEGKLVPNEIVCQLLLNRIRQPDCAARGFILDGFPRNLPQAELLAKVGISIDAIVHLDVTPEVTLSRIVGRVVDTETGVSYHLKYRPPPEDRLKFLRRRKDDSEEIGRKRLTVYAQTVQPLLQYYRHKPTTRMWDFRISDTRQTVESIFKEVRRRVDAFLRHGLQSSKSRVQSRL